MKASASSSRSRSAPDPLSRSVLLLDPDPATLRAGCLETLARVGHCGPRLALLADSLARAIGDYGRCGIGSLHDCSYLYAPRPGGGRAVRLFPGPAADRLAPLLLRAIGA
jgi:hypothetical protein